MDSGNSSGSMQSSSGGEEEYDSRAESNVAAFLNPSGHFGSPSNLQQQQQPHQHQQLQSRLYDPSPIFGAAFSHQSPSNPVPNTSFLNLDAFRSGGSRSELGHDLPSGSPSTAPPSSSNQSITAAHQGSSQGPLSRSSLPSDQTTHPDGVAPRNPKKRTRASRRAPTTVLTTDTSNFRAMVQEFTGIPALPPFSGSPFSRRLDFFGSGSGLRSSHLEPLGSIIYPLRPSAQKVHNMVDATNIATTAANNINNNTISLTSSVTTTSSSIPSSINYQLPSSDLSGLSMANKQPQNMLNMQNQMLSFQSLLQPQQPLHTSFNVPAGLGAKSTISLPLPSFEELGMSHGHVNSNLSGLPSHHHVTTTTEGNVMRLRNDGIWRDHGGAQDQHLRQPFDGDYSNSLLSANCCKFNHSSSPASSSDFHHFKG